MPQHVSKAHKELITRVRELFPEREVIGWPDPEVNLGHLAGMTNCNLRADIFIWWDKAHTQAVVIEYQSGIHSLIKGSTWHNPDEISGRDGLKKELITRIGATIIEIDEKQAKNITDQELKNIVMRGAESSSVETKSDKEWIRPSTKWQKRTLKMAPQAFKPRKTNWEKQSFKKKSF